MHVDTSKECYERGACGHTRIVRISPAPQPEEAVPEEVEAALTRLASRYAMPIGTLRRYLFTDLWR